MMKKILKSFVLIFVVFIIPFTTISAKTIAQLEKELEAAEKKLNDTNVKKAANNQDINETTKKINTIKADIEKINSEIDAKTKESEQLEKDIKKKNEEIKDLMKYYEVSSSGSTMLEYIMGAESLTDLIYRLSITEQISSYNKKTIKKMNDMIAENEKIKKELASKKEQLTSLKNELDTQLVVLGQKQRELSNDGMEASQEIEETKKQIKYYRSIGCEDNDSISVCVSNYYAKQNGSSSNGTYLPSGTTFFRPTTSGRMSSGFGMRTLRGSANNHFAVDISVPIGTPVYATAPGIVWKIIPDKGKKSCGNSIVIHHYINGAYYTSYYCHLSSFNVKVNDIVTKDTVIAKSGNTGNSTGPHLHLGLATGRWYIDYFDYYEYGRGSFQSHTFDPRKVITFPPIGSNYYNR